MNYTLTLHWLLLNELWDSSQFSYRARKFCFELSPWFVMSLMSIHIMTTLISYVMRSRKMSLKWKFFCFVFFCFWHFLLRYYISFNLVKTWVKTLWRLGNWFLRNSTWVIAHQWKTRNYLLCLVISLNQYLRVLTHFAWLYHIYP